MKCDRFGSGVYDMLEKGVDSSEGGDPDDGRKFASRVVDVVQSAAVSNIADMNSLEYVGEIIEPTDSALMSTSAVLYYCKSKILHPYLKLLALMGLRPVSLNQIANSSSIRIISNYHTFQILLLTCIGYVLQYMSCFRRDRGFYFRSIELFRSFENFTEERQEVCYANSVFSFYIPDALHLVGYLYTIYLFRISDSEQLQNLMERVFLSSSFPPQRTPYTSPRKLLKVLWIYIILSMLWMLSSLVVVSLMTSSSEIQFLWFPNESQCYILVGKIFLVLCTFMHDMVQGTVICSYCMQAQLLRAHLFFLKHRLLTRTISPLDWMREMAEFKKLLNHLNDVFAPVVCIFLILNISWILSGFGWIFSMDKIDALKNHNMIIHSFNLTIWIIAAIIPFISAARLTSACSMAQISGHDIAVRPFLYQDATQETLNAVLLYASSLKLSAKLYRMPVTGRHLCLIATSVLIISLTFGMCHYIAFI